MELFLGCFGPVIVDDVKETESKPRKVEADIALTIAECPTGWNFFSRDSGGVIIEWVQWRADIWDG